MPDQLIRRRSFLQFNLVALAALGTALRSGDAYAIQKRVPAGVPLVDPQDPQAQALSYTPAATEAVGEKPQASPETATQMCSNCQLYSGTPGADWGPCAIFSYRIDPKTKLNLVVSADGWCKGWAPRAS